MLGPRLEPRLLSHCAIIATLTTVLPYCRPAVLPSCLQKSILMHLKYTSCTGVSLMLRRIEKYRQISMVGMTNCKCWHCKTLFTNAYEFIEMWRSPVFISITQFYQASVHLDTALARFKKTFICFASIRSSRDIWDKKWKAFYQTPSILRACLYEATHPDRPGWLA